MSCRFASPSHSASHGVFWELRLVRPVRLRVGLSRSRVQSQCLAVLFCASSAADWAQVAVDGSLGPLGPITGPNFQITAALGKQVGGNLFHSFSEFNLKAGEAATFSGPDSVGNIISRVTGSTFSSIDGTLRSTIPGASLFLM